MARRVLGPAALFIALPTLPAWAASPPAVQVMTLSEPPVWQPGTSDPARLDPDADGVPSDRDSCPRVPNPPLKGVQRDVCSATFKQHADDHVFLKSRVFPAPDGLEPALAQLKGNERVHVVLHVAAEASGELLQAPARRELEGLGVRWLGYLPHRSYYVSLPTGALAQAAQVSGVQGISGRLPVDKLDRALRVRGPADRSADGRFALLVEFFEDVPRATVEALLAKLGLPFFHQYDLTYQVELDSWQALVELVNVDAVKWVDEPDGEPVDYTLNAQAAIGADLVVDRYGYRGQGLTVAMFETAPLTVNPEHPNMRGRVTIGNTPEFAYDEAQHAWNVAAILIADETVFPNNLGLLPDAELVSYSAGLQTRKRRFYGIPTEAREDYDAFVFNNSWGDYKCSKIGEYTKHAKFRDRAIFDNGIIMVDGAGNGRHPTAGYPPEGCAPTDYSLGLYNAKNSIMVGAWDLATNALSTGSSIGPSADGRLKPDLVAPGGSVDTLGFRTVELADVSGTPIGGLQLPEFIGASFPVSFSGTSAAAPVVSGVVGWMGEAFGDVGYPLDTIQPATIKAILVHTARDVGLPGPDFSHGYGLIQPGPALRIVHEWSTWGRQHTFTEAGEEFSFYFDIDSATYSYKVTLAWDDVEGEDTSDRALINNLDLTLVSPSGAMYRPFDLEYPAGATTPAEPCPVYPLFGDEQPPCDTANNVEQVIARNDDGSALETGQWVATVRAARLVSDEQPASLVLTPPCPVVIDQDVTLTESITCEPHPLDPVAVKVVSDDVTLNCDEESISGYIEDLEDAGVTIEGFIGVDIQGQNVSVEHCVLDSFDTGVRVGTRGAPVSGAEVRFNTLSEIRRHGIDAWGDDHRIGFNTVDGMVRGAHGGVRLNAGTGSWVNANELRGGASGVNYPVGVDVTPGVSNALVTLNYITGSWAPAILLESSDETKPIVDSFVTANHVFEVPLSGIELNGLVLGNQASTNIIHAYGQDGIVVQNSGALKPDQNLISTNAISGDATADIHDVGITVRDTDWTTVQANLIADVNVGISDIGSEVSWIKGNALYSLAEDYRGAVAIFRSGGSVTQIDTNHIWDYTSGISVLNGGTLDVRGNTPIEVSVLGISAANVEAPEISGNGIQGAITGILLSASDDAQITGNGVYGYRGRGIHTWRSNNLTVSGNSLEEVDLEYPETEAGTAIHLAEGVTATIDLNTITSHSSSQSTGILLGYDPAPPCSDIVVEEVTVVNNTMISTDNPFVAGCDVGVYTLAP